MSKAAAIVGLEGARSLGAQFAAARGGVRFVHRTGSERRISAWSACARSSATITRNFRIRAMPACILSAMPNISAFRFRKYDLLPDPGVCGTEGYQYLQGTSCDYVRTDVGPLSRRRRLLPKLVTAALLVLFSLGGFKLWITVRDVERLRINSMASEDKAALAVLDNQKAVAPASVTPESPSD